MCRNPGSLRASSPSCRGRGDEWHLLLGNAFGHLAFHLGPGLGQPAVVIPSAASSAAARTGRGGRRPGGWRWHRAGRGTGAAGPAASPAGPSVEQRLERLQRLQRPLEADRPRRDVVPRRGLGHHRADQVVRQDVRPHLLADQLRRLAPQLAHLHRRLERPQVELGVPPRPVQRRPGPPWSPARGSSRVVTTTTDRVRNPGCSTRTRASRTVIDVGQRLVRLPVQRPDRRRLGPADDVVVRAQPPPAAEVGPAVGRVQPADQVDAPLLEQCMSAQLAISRSASRTSPGRARPTAGGAG